MEGQRLALQKQLRPQAVTDKSGTETIPKSVCDSGHLEAEISCQRERAAERRCESSKQLEWQQALGKLIPGQE